MPLRRTLVGFFFFGLFVSPGIAGIFAGFHRNRETQTYGSEPPRENERQPASTITVYKTLITTNTRVFIIHHAPCAKLINVTGECKMRKGRFVEDPVVLTFDDETEKYVDVLYTPVVSLETTRKPGDVYSDYPLQSELLLSEEPKISPSFEDGNNEDLENSNRNARYYFSHVADALQPLRLRATASIKTITYYSTVFTSTKRTSRNTFFVQGCTPSYFPFHICSKSNLDHSY